MYPTDLPVFKMTCSEFDNMEDWESIHLVENPAIKEHWLLFSEEKTPFIFTTSNDEQRIITGPILIPDLPVKRFQPVVKGGEPIKFYAVADKETVRATAKMYARNRKLNAIGIEHGKQYPEGVHLFQCFLSDAEAGINNPKGFESLPDGTLYASYLIDNDKVWQDAKDGKLNGYSIQALFGLEPVNVDADEDAETLVELAELEEMVEKITNKYSAAIQ